MYMYVYIPMYMYSTETSCLKRKILLITHTHAQSHPRPIPSFRDAIIDLVTCYMYMHVHVCSQCNYEIWNGVVILESALVTHVHHTIAFWIAYSYNTCTVILHYHLHHWAAGWVQYCWQRPWCHPRGAGQSPRSNQDTLHGQRRQQMHKCNRILLEIFIAPLFNKLIFSS